MCRLVASTNRPPQGFGIQYNTETQLGNMDMDQKRWEIPVGNEAHIELSGCMYNVPILWGGMFRIKVIL